MASSTFSKRLNEIILKKNIKPAEIAKISEQLYLEGKVPKPIKKPTLSAYLKGDYEAKQDNIYTLSKILNINEAWLMGYDVDIKRTPDEERGNKKAETNVFPIPDKPMPVPIIGNIAAGMPILAVQNIIGYAYLPESEFNKRPNSFYLAVKGDSMNKKFQNGDLVLVDPDIEVCDGDIAAVLIDDEATVKEFHSGDGVIILQPLSTNKEHQMQIYNLRKTKVKVIGKVVSFQGKV